MTGSVLGGGVIGVTSAYYLAKAVHEVEVIERQPGVALETSFANAGEVSPGYASPWAAPGIPQKAIKWLMMKHPPLRRKLLTKHPQHLPLTRKLLLKRLQKRRPPRLSPHGIPSRFHPEFHEDFGL